MNATMPLTLARALAPMAPPQSVVHQALSEHQRIAIDLAVHKIKQNPIVRLEREAERLCLAEARMRDLTGSLA